MANPQQHAMTRTEWTMLLALSLLWGGSFFFNGVLVRELPALTIVAGRVLIAAIALWVIIRGFGIKMPNSQSAWIAFLGMGLLNNVLPFSLIVWGQREIASGLASILNATTPLFTVVVAHVLTHEEKATPAKIAGVLLGLGGVAVLIGPDVLRGLGTNLIAQLAVLGGAVSYAFAGVYGRLFKRMGIDPVATATGQVTASALFLLPIALVVDKPWAIATPSAVALAALLGLALLSTALAYILFFRILATAGPTNVLLVTFLVPVSAIILGVLVLGESIGPRQPIGMLLIGCGLAAIDGRAFGFVGRRRSKLPQDKESFLGQDI